MFFFYTHKVAVLVMTVKSKLRLPKMKVENGGWYGTALRSSNEFSTAIPDLAEASVTAKAAC